MANLIANFFTMDNALLILRLATPIILVAMSSTISELAGVISLGTEGLMLMGAFGAVAGSHFTGNGWLGMLIGMLTGMATAGLFAILCVKLRANQTVCGVGLNLFATGITAVGTFVIWDKEGISDAVTQIPSITVPVLNRIPVMGALFTKQSPIIYITLLLVAAGWYIMKYSRVGLRLKAISMHPVAARTAGISVERYRYVSLLIAGALAGMGGGFLSIVQNNVFVKNMVSGRGFLGVAANIFGGWSIPGSAGASFIFGIAQSVRYNMLEINVPDQFVQALPYLITIIALVLIGKRSKSPEALGKIQ